MITREHQEHGIRTLFWGIRIDIVTRTVRTCLPRAQTVLFAGVLVKISDFIGQPTGEKSVAKFHTSRTTWPVEYNYEPGFFFFFVFMIKHHGGDWFVTQVYKSLCRSNAQCTDVRVAFTLFFNRSGGSRVPSSNVRNTSAYFFPSSPNDLARKCSGIMA